MHCPSYNKKEQGFTLIELSIVLIIIGLLVAGIVAGNSLIAAAKVNRLIIQYKEYVTAMNAFMLQYDSLPGDFDEAESYWGSVTSNGKGNGYLSAVGGGQFKNVDGLLFWQHLALAEIIPGSYEGYDGNDSPYLEPGVNVPFVKGYNDVVWHWRDTWITNSPHKNILKVGTISSSTESNSGSNSNFLLPREAKRIDVKLDDGLVNAGKIIGQFNDCRTAGNTLWNLSNTEPVCSVNFLFTLGETF